jgi:hypothetical protein
MFAVFRFAGHDDFNLFRYLSISLWRLAPSSDETLPLRPYKHGQPDAYERIMASDD